MSRVSRVSQVIGFTPEEEQALVKRSLPEGYTQEMEDCFLLKLTDAEWNSCKAIREAVSYSRYRKTRFKNQQTVYPINSEIVQRKNHVNQLGFDPLQIIDKYFKLARKDPADREDKLIVVTSLLGHRIEVFEKSDSRRDLEFLLNIYLEGGNNFNRTLLKCASTLHNFIRRKTANYLIHPNNLKLDLDSLTLERLAFSFAECTAQLILSHGIPGKLKTQTLIDIAELPLLLQHAIFPALIPINVAAEITNGLRDVAIVLNIEMKIQTSAPANRRRMEIKQVGDLLKVSKLYIDAAATANTFIHDRFKLIVLKRAKICETDGLTTIGQRLVTAARSFITYAQRNKHLSYPKTISAWKQEAENKTDQGATTSGVASDSFENEKIVDYLRDHVTIDDK